MRKVLALVSAAVLASSACTVGDEDQPQSSDAKEITFLVFETPNLTPQYWDAAIKRVTDKNPGLKVKKLVSPSVDRTAYAKQLLASNQFPDVMIAVSPTGFAEAGHIYAWQPDELKDFAVPDAGAIGGKIYQLPANTQTIPVVYYNKKLFAAAGITKEPATYAELLDAAAKLKAKNITPFVVGGGKDAFASSLAWTALVATDVYAKMPDWITKRRGDQVKFTDPDFTGAAQKFAELAAKGYIDKRDIARDYAATEQAFFDGKGAMYPMGNWFAAAADGKQKKGELKFEVGAFNWPSADGSMVVPAFTGGGLVVSAKAKNLDEARKFALGFQLDKANLDNSVAADGLIPAIKDYQLPAETGPVYKLGYDLYQKGVAEQAVVPAFSWEVGDTGLLPGMVDKVYASAQDLITGRKTAEQVGRYLDAEWTKAS
jgi:ABC-type glycerol-3-phosphate transport system substrate-binding protein